MILKQIFLLILICTVTVLCIESDDSSNDNARPSEDYLTFSEDLCRGEVNNKKLPNPFDEQSYFECYKGETIEKLCPGKQKFNVEKNMCVGVKVTPKTVVKPKIIKKEVQIKPKAKPSLKPKLPKTEPPHIRMIRDTHAQEQQSTVCKDQPSFTFVSHPVVCDKYYLCVLEIAHERNCSAGKWFEEELQECVPMRQSTCEPQIPEDFCEGIPNFHFLESPHACYLYYMCVNEVPYYKLCNDNLWFSQKQQKCDVPKNVDCSLETSPEPPKGICVDVPNFKYVRHPDKCDEYFQCIFDMAYARKCAEGKYFNEERQICDDKENVDCVRK